MSRIYKTSGQPHRPSGSAPRVLYITNSLPFPPHGGGQLREANLIRRLGSRADIDLRVLTENYDRDCAHIEEAKQHCTSVGIFETQTRGDSSIPRGTPKRLARYQSPQFDGEIARLLSGATFDLVHAEGYFIATHLPERIGVPLVLIEENIEYQLDREHREPWKVARNTEHTMWDKATIIGAVAESDLDAMKFDRPGPKTFYSPNGHDHIKAFKPRHHTDNRLSVSYVGNFGWKPTGDAAQYLVEQIWPDVLRHLPQATLTLAGAGLTNRFAGPNVLLAGEVPSVADFYSKTDVFACPTRSGSGVRVKMVEALSMGTATVCTDVALRGLPPEAREAVVVANDPLDFAEKLVGLLQQPEKRQELSNRAFDVGRNLPTWDAAADVLYDRWVRAIELGQGISASGSRTRSAPSLATGISSSLEITPSTGLADPSTTSLRPDLPRAHPHVLER